MRSELGTQGGGGRLLLHAAPQYLVGRDQHDAYDEGHGKGADEALPDTGLSVLFLGMHWGWGSRQQGHMEGGEGERRENDTVRQAVALPQQTPSPGHRRSNRGDRHFWDHPLAEETKLHVFWQMV